MARINLHLEKIYQSRIGKTRCSYSLSPRGEAQNAILEHDTSSVSQKDGVDRIIVHLNQQYKKDELTWKISCPGIIWNMEMQTQYIHLRISQWVLKRLLGPFRKSMLCPKAFRSVINCMPKSNFCQYAFTI